MELQNSLPHSQSPAPVPILSQSKLVHAFPSHFLKVHFNIVFPYMKYINYRIFISCSFHKADHRNHQVTITDIAVVPLHVFAYSHCYSTISLTEHKILLSHKLIEYVLKYAYFCDTHYCVIQNRLNNVLCSPILLFC